MAKRKGDFKQSTIALLAKRVAYRCSNPDCRRSTLGPAGTNSTALDGEGAHICAASPGGKRFDPTMSHEARTSFANGIYLCSICAKKIDRDEAKYPISLLNEWKQTAEDHAQREYGNQLPSEQDARDLLSMTLGGLPKTFLATAIANTHGATVKSLEMLDPRFTIKSSYESDITRFDITPCSDSVPLTLKANNGFEREFIEKYKSLLERGEQLTINCRSLSIEGSPLFETIFELGEGDKGVFSMVPEKRPAIVKLMTHQSDGTHYTFEETHGDIVKGTQSFKFTGEACSGVFKFSFEREFSYTGTMNVLIDLNFESWRARTLDQLPYFDKLLNFFAKLVAADELTISLEMYGNIVCTHPIDAKTLLERTTYINDILRYIDTARIISRFLNKKLQFSDDISFHESQLKKLEQYANIILDKSTQLKKDIHEKIIIEIVLSIDAASVADFFASGRRYKLRVSYEAVTITLFGIELDLPAHNAVFDNVMPVVLSDMALLTPGQLIKLELIPQDNFKYSVSFDSDTPTQLAL